MNTFQVSNEMAIARKAIQITVKGVRKPVTIDEEALCQIINAALRCEMIRMQVSEIDPQYKNAIISGQNACCLASCDERDDDAVYLEMDMSNVVEGIPRSINDGGCEA